MRKTPLRKSAVLQEGYKKGLREALAIINEMMEKEEPCEMDGDLLDAILADDSVAVKAAIEAGASLNCVNDEGYGPLEVAAMESCPKAAAALIKAGADVNAKAPEGAHPVYWAALDGNAEVLLTLIKAGADVNVTDDGETPLEAAKARRTEYMREYGEDAGWGDCIKILMKSGATR